MSTKESNNSEKIILNEKALARISAALRGIRFGSVTITIHDARIVQIERIEKSRFDDLAVEHGGGI